MEQLSLAPGGDMGVAEDVADMAELIAQLDAARIGRNWTYGHLGRRAGVSPTTARAVLEHTQVPHLRTFMKLAAALDVRIVADGEHAAT